MGMKKYEHFFHCFIGWVHKSNLGAGHKLGQPKSVHATLPRLQWRCQCLQVAPVVLPPPSKWQTLPWWAAPSPSKHHLLQCPTDGYRTQTQMASLLTVMKFLDDVPICVMCWAISWLGVITHHNQQREVFQSDHLTRKIRFPKMSNYSFEHV